MRVPVRHAPDDLVLDRALVHVDRPGVTDDDLVQAAVELLDSAVLSPWHSYRVERARRRALARWEGRPGVSR